VDKYTPSFRATDEAPVETRKIRISLHARYAGSALKTFPIAKHALTSRVTSPFVETMHLLVIGKEIFLFHFSRFS
jgi:hypothetical protein